MSSKNSKGPGSLSGTGVAGIILAAGEGRRLGGNKALLDIAGVTSLDRLATCMLDAGCDPVMVVGGAQAESVRQEALRLGVQFALNRNWKNGQFSSLKTGVSWLAGAGGSRTIPVGAMVALVDVPLVRRETYKILVGTFRRFPERIVIPTNQDRRGHPIIVPREIIRRVASSPDGMTLRDIIKKYDHLVLEQAVDDTGILKDIDTEIDLKGTQF